MISKLIKKIQALTIEIIKTIEIKRSSMTVEEIIKESNKDKHKLIIDATPGEGFLITNKKHLLNSYSSSYEQKMDCISMRIDEMEEFEKRVAYKGITELIIVMEAVETCNQEMLKAMTYIISANYSIDVTWCTVIAKTISVRYMTENELLELCQTKEAIVLSKIAPNIPDIRLWNTSSKTIIPITKYNNEYYEFDCSILTATLSNSNKLLRNSQQYVKQVTVRSNKLPQKLSLILGLCSKIIGIGRDKGEEKEGNVTTKLLYGTVEKDDEIIKINKSICKITLIILEITKPKLWQNKWKSGILIIKYYIRSILIYLAQKIMRKKKQDKANEQEENEEQQPII